MNQHSCRLLWGAVLVFWVAPPASALVISEIHYHPSELDAGSVEFLELYNENADPLDLSGFQIVDGVRFEFPSGTWLDGRSCLVVCADEAAVRAKYSISNAIGNWVGALANGGEKIEIANPGGRVVLSVDYRDGGKWPVGADGTGHSLSLRSPFLEVDDPDSWVLSTDLDGTPGEPNFPDFQTGGVLPPTAPGLDPSGFVRTWLVLGPYEGAGCGIGEALLTRDWLREPGLGAVTESDLIWRDGQVVRTSYTLAESTGLHPNAGTALPTLKTYEAFGDTIDLDGAVYPPGSDDVMAYAFAYVDNVTDSPLVVDIACASDDAIAILLNGMPVHVNDQCRGVGGAGSVQDRAPATLEVGKNLVVVKVFERGGGWAFRLRFEDRGTTSPIAVKSRIQVTTDSDEGLLFGGGGEPIVPPDDGDPTDPGAGPDAYLPSPVVINEALLSGPGAPWIELFNRSGSLLDLTGYHVTNDPSDLMRATLPAGTSIPAGGLLVLTGGQLGLDLSLPPLGENRLVALVEPGGRRVLDAANLDPAFEGLSEARVPDGDSELSDAADPTPGEPNRLSVNGDVVINEVMYHPLDGDADREFVELYHRGSEPVNLEGWRFSNGIDWTFSAGQVLQPGGYLVIARAPARIRSLYGLSASQVIGPETDEGRDDFGRLRDGGERITLKDELGRTVDTVRYHDGGEWPRWPDGLGSSMERIDPYADGRIGQAWDASDDSAEADTTELSYTGRHAGVESELHLALLARGISIVDDISITGDGTETADTPLVDAGETWRYFKGTQEPPTSWKDVSFNDGSWIQGATGIGYGDSDDATVLDDMQNGYLTVFCRKIFLLSDPEDVDDLVLSVVVDDGFYAYLNGQQVVAHKVAGAAFDQPASAGGEPELVERDLTLYKSLLRVGPNVLSIQVHNVGIDSSDLSCIPRLLSRTTIVSGGGTELVSNGDFETDTRGWMIEGTHVRSGRTTIDPIDGSGSLKIIASGRGDNKVNRIETPEPNGDGLAVLKEGADLRISFKARWVVGSQTLLTHGYQHTMAKAHSLLVPDTLGTPGAINSVTERWIEETGDANLGPLVDGVTQEPAVPGGGEDVVVTARVVDPDGVRSATLRYSLQNATPFASSVPMTLVAGDVYRAVIPGRPLGTTVVFWIETVDVDDRAGRYPLDVARRTHPLILDPTRPGIQDHRYCVYRHDARDPLTPYHDYRFWMTAADETELGTRKNLSNDLLPGSFVFGGSRIYHNAAVRFSGSPFARGKWGSFRVAFPRDDLLHGSFRKFNLDNHHGNGVNARERISHYLIRKNQGRIGVPYSDTQVIARWQVNGRGATNLERVWVPDVQYLSFWYPDDDDGDFFEVDDRFVINDAGGRDGNTNAYVLYPPSSFASDGDGANKENYRWFFGLRAKNGADDFSRLIDFAQLLDPSATSNAAIGERIFDEANVEEMLRIWAVRWNTDDWDEWGARRGKNCYLYRPAESGRWELLAWDMELTYGNTTTFNIPPSLNDPFNPGSFPEVNRLVSLPVVRRMYYGILKEMMVGPDAWFRSSHLKTYMQKLAAIGMAETDKGMPGGYIDQRAAIVTPLLESALYPRVRLRITTQGGASFSTAGLRVDLSGTAPAEISDIIVMNNGNEGVVYPLEIDGLTTWTIRGISLVPGPNSLTLVGVDLKGSPVDSTTIQVTSTEPIWEAPTIQELRPDRAQPGEDIEIVGTGFHDLLHVQFGEIPSPYVLFDEAGPTPETITARVPEGVGTVRVSVRNADGKTSTGALFTYGSVESVFLRGDANHDDRVDLSDAVAILSYLFLGGDLDCEDAGDSNDDEELNITDALHVLNYLFQGGAAPAPPFPTVGPDPRGSVLGCSR